MTDLKTKLQEKINVVSKSNDYEIMDETIIGLKTAFKGIFGYSVTPRIEGFFLSWSCDQIFK